MTGGYVRPHLQAGGLAIGGPAIARAAGQHGRVTLDITIPEAPGSPGNAGTLVDLGWGITKDGGLHLTLYVDGIPAWEGLLR